MSWIMFQVQVRRFVLWFLRPIIIMIPKFHAPWIFKKIKARQYRHVMTLLQPGDLILCRTLGELSNYLIPGFFKHLQVYAPTQHKHEIIEAVGTGVQIADTIDALLSKDALLVLRLKDATFQQGAEIAEMARQQVGKPYDLEFKWQSGKNKAFYCFELGIWSCKQVMGDKFDFKLRMDWGRPTVTADDILKSSLYEVVWDSRSA